MKDTLVAFYLDWVNNYLTIEKMAEHNQLTENETTQLIEMGRKYHEENVERIKQIKR